MAGIIFWIPMNTASAKNGKVSFGAGVADSSLTKRWKHRTKRYFVEQAEDFKKTLGNLPMPYYIEFTFIRESKRRFDYPNVLQGIYDQMVECGWIPDDETRVIKPYFGDPVYDKLNPGCEIRILKNKPKHY